MTHSSVLWQPSGMAGAASHQNSGQSFRRELAATTLEGYSGQHSRQVCSACAQEGLLTQPDRRLEWMSCVVASAS